MTVKTWETLKVQSCAHPGTQVGLEAEVVYPPEWLPEQGRRVVAHRCSHGLACNLDGRVSCVWAGSNPAFDPFAEGR
jgi:hypothetical protein